MVFILGIPYLVYLMIDWDMRSPSVKRQEANYAVGKRARHPFMDHIHTGEVVAWAGQPLKIWFQLGTSGYVSTQQAIGIVFSSDKTFEAARRQHRMAVAAELKEGESEKSAWARVLQSRLAENMDIKSIHDYGVKGTTSAGISYLCQDPVLDWVVSDQDSISGEKSTWSASSEFHGDTLHLYDCRHLRSREST